MIWEGREERGAIGAAFCQEESYVPRFTSSEGGWMVRILEPKPRFLSQ